MLARRSRRIRTWCGAISTLRSLWGALRRCRRSRSKSIWREKFVAPLKRPSPSLPKMAEIGKMSRMFASVIYGRSVPTGSMEKSIEYLNRAVTLNPTVIVSRLELARSYIAVENWSSARSFLTSIRGLPAQFSDDAKNKQKAEQLLEEVKDR